MKKILIFSNIVCKECIIWFMALYVSHYLNNIILGYNSLNFVSNHGPRPIPSAQRQIFTLISNFKGNNLLYSAWSPLWYFESSLLAEDAWNFPLGPKSRDTSSDYVEGSTRSWPIPGVTYINTQIPRIALGVDRSVQIFRYGLRPMFLPITL